MTPTSERWVSLGEPASSEEESALNAFRALLPDDGVTRAWANLTFLDTNRRSGEIDVLLLSPVGLVVVELKGWHGTIAGDQQNWRIQRPGTSRWDVVRNPYFLADSKAKRLASLLRKHDGRRSHSGVPFISAAVVLHGRDSRIELDDLAASHLLALDGYNVQGLPEGATLSQFLRTPPANPGHQISAAHAAQIADLIESAGFVPRPRIVTVGQYQLTDKEPIATGKNWHDHLATHPDMPKLVRRVRIFDLPEGASRVDREELERLAQRELSLTRGIRHSGIEGPLDFVGTDAGPALVFDHDPDAIPLADYLSDTDHSRRLTFANRLALIRQIAEVVGYAHSRRLTHRALSPERVRVVNVDGAPQVRIRDWMTGRRTEASSSQPTLTVLSAGVSDVAGRWDFDQWVYLAPESLRGGSDLPPIPLDVYGLGALAHLIITGEPPAKDIAELEARISDRRPLNAAATRPDLPEPLVKLIADATAASELDRPESVQDFLDRLVEVENEAATPSTTVVEPVDPLDAVPGSTVGGRFEVRARRGLGSTGVALLVDDPAGGHEGAILKIARDAASAERIDAEAATLAGLRHPRIVQLLEGPFDVDGRRAILLSDAGQKTLADRLASDGRATIEQLENFGKDLLEALAYLESQGLFHRDIKPTNLGIAPDRGSRRPRLTLFDLSLAPEPVERLGSGTPGYMDPFLGKGRRRQYDRAAELYAASVTLFEMARGELPTWAQGDSVPDGSADRVVLQTSSFDAGVAENLVAFFSRALHPDAAKRFSNATDLGRAWASVFAELDPSSDDASQYAQATLAERAAAATLTTRLPDSGLSPRALSALAAREDLATVAELIGVSMMQLNSLPGLGERYRRELTGRVREWRARLLAGSTVVDSYEPAQGRLGVEHVAESLLPRKNAATSLEHAVLTALLGLEDSAVSSWPTSQELATSLRVSRADVDAALTNASRRWEKGKRLVSTRAVLAQALEAQKGVASVGELASALTLSLGSALEGERRQRVAMGVVRAVAEAEERRVDPSLITRRVQSDGAPGSALIATTDPALPLSGEEGLSVAVALAARADELISDRSLVGKDLAAGSLREVVRRVLDVEMSSLLDDDRLLRVATSSATRARMSSRGELYPYDLPGKEAVLMALRGSAAKILTAERARERVSNRFPAVSDIPEGPAFTRLVTEAVPALKWDGERFTQEGLTSGVSVTSRTVTDLHAVDAPFASRALKSSLQTRSALALAVPPSRYIETAESLAHQYGVRVLDAAALVVVALRKGAAVHGAQWDAVTDLDARPELEARMGILRVLAREVVPSSWADAVASQDPLLIVNAGPLARYGVSDLLSRIFDLSEPRPAARWLLVARRASERVPTLDGHAVPMGPDGWLDIPIDLTEMGVIA